MGSSGKHYRNHEAALYLVGGSNNTSIPAQGGGRRDSSTCAGSSPLLTSCYQSGVNSAAHAVMLSTPTCVCPNSDEQLDGPDDAESCCGDHANDLHGPFDEILSADRQTSADALAPQQQLQQQQHCSSSNYYSTQLAATAACSHSSNDGSSTGTVHMGDDFECMASEDVSMLLEETPEYPGGVEAALADWAEACSQEQATSTSAGSAVEQHSRDILHRLLPPVVQVLQQQPVHGASIPSLESLLVTPTLSPCYPANMLPCCQWGAFEGDAVGEVLAGKLPVPHDSNCSSAGLTASLMGYWG